MITVITAFQFPKPITREEARRIFLSAAPRYLGVADLQNKRRPAASRSESNVQAYAPDMIRP
jgi:hypothetical protein